MKPFCVASMQKGFLLDRTYTIIVIQKTLRQIDWSVEMKNFELQATFDNVLETYKRDMWGRNVDVRAFVELLHSIEESCSIAIDARWGSGKTFFVKQAKLVLDAFNINSSQMDEDTRDSVILSYGQSGDSTEVELQPQVAVYYDAWANDNDEDPVLSLVYAIMQSVNTDFDFKNGVDCLNIITSIAEAITGRSVTAIREALEQDDPMAHLGLRRICVRKYLNFWIHFCQKGATVWSSL